MQPSKTSQPDRTPKLTKDSKIHIVLVGDSTVTDRDGWGLGFNKRLGANARCSNRASSGRSSKSYYDNQEWQQALKLKPDYVLIQFGHNDQPGKGSDRETHPQTTYREYLSRYVDEARAIGARPILVTSLSRRNFTARKRITSSLWPYTRAMIQLAAEKKVPLVDLHARSIARLNKIGPKAALAHGYMVKGTSTPDRTHLSKEGGRQTAELVIAELEKVVPEMAAYFSQKGN